MRRYRFGRSVCSRRAASAMFPPATDSARVIRQVEEETRRDADARFDLAVLSHVLEHAEHPRRLLAEASRVARVLFVEVPLEDTWRLARDFTPDAVGHINFYSMASLRRLVQSCGLEVLDERVVPPGRAIALGFTGPMLRGSGIEWDLRKKQPYAVYDRVDFDIPVGAAGDCYERYLIRLEEMYQSLRIVEQALPQLPAGPFMGNAPKALRPPKGEAYQRVENSRGDFGVYVVSDGRSSAPYRVKYRSPSYCNLQALQEMVIGLYVADAVVALGSIDIVLGEIDR